MILRPSRRIYRPPDGPFEVNWGSPQAQDLLAFWPMGWDSIGTLSLQEYVRANTASLDGSHPPTWSPSPNGGYELVFNGSDTWGSAPYRAALNGADKTLTYTTWLRFTSSNDGLIFFCHSDGVNKGFIWFVQAGNVWFLTKHAFGNAAYRSSTSAINDGAWHSVLVVSTTDTSVTANNDIQIYIDGRLDQGALTQEGRYTSSTELFYFGRRSSGSYYDGAMRDLRIYDGDKSYLAPHLWAPSTRYDLYHPMRRNWVAKAAEAPPASAARSSVVIIA